MASNSFGHLFRITTSGESHGPGLGVIIDGCPPGLLLDTTYIQRELDRRKPGQSSIVSPRMEDDKIEIRSGIYDGKTTGAPILIIIPNQDQRPADYEHVDMMFRPSHADFTYHHKYGIRDHRGGGRASARETANWVAAGAIAKLYLRQHNITIRAAVTSIGEIDIDLSLSDFNWPEVENNIVRAPDQETARRMQHLVEQVRLEGDTVGGRITCLVEGCPAGLGAPVFRKLEADLAHAMLNINASKGFEFGSGFAGTKMRGSRHNDAWQNEGDIITTATNHSGGIQGGISNGQPIYFTVAFKPVSTIMQDQSTVNISGDEVTVQGKGRHDPCVVPRAVPIVEAMTALVIMDHWLLHKIYHTT